MSAPTPVLCPSPRTALLIMSVNGETLLCPFFGKCDGLMVIDPASGRREVHVNTGRTPEAMYDLILKVGVHRLVLGFIAGPAARKLQTAGVDIRLGSCMCAVEDLAVRFEDLPSL